MSKKKVVRIARISQVCTYDVPVEVDEDATDKEVDDAAMDVWGMGSVHLHEVECYTDDLRVMPYSDDDQW